MSYYEILLVVHIAAAIVWLGSGFFLQMLIFRAESSDDEGLKLGIASNTGWFAQRIFIPASLVVLVGGVLLTIEGPWSFGDLWIVLGLAGYAVSFLVGILFLEPEGKRIHAAMAAGEQARAAFLIRRINAVSRLELVVLYLVVGAMALKPTGDDTGTLILGAALLLAALVFWAPKLRTPPPAAATG
jgi:uncharacterized membrane protein